MLAIYLISESHRYVKFVLKQFNVKKHKQQHNRQKVETVWGRDNSRMLLIKQGQ